MLFLPLAFPAASRKPLCALLLLFSLSFHFFFSTLFFVQPSNTWRTVLLLAFVCIPGTISFSSCLFAVHCSAQQLERAFSTTFAIASFPLSTAQMLLHCWACRLASNHPHILRVAAEFFTANSPPPRAIAFTSKRHLTLTQLAWRKDCSFSAERLEVCFSTSLRLPRAYSRASARPAVRWACRLSRPDFSPRTPYCIDFSVQHSSRISRSASFSLQHSLSPYDHFLCHLLDSLVRQGRKHSFSLEDRKVSERTFQVSHN